MKPKDLMLVRRLLELDKPSFGIADLEKILRQRRPSVYVTLHRLVRYGVLIRLGRGLYQAALKAPDLARVANALVYPSYLSFESALARHGILSQVPLALSFATSHRSQRRTLGDTAVEFHHLKPSLFFGYVPAHGLYVAEPEKALLDQLYLASRGRARLVTEALDLSPVDPARLRVYARPFPPSVRAAAHRILQPAARKASRLAAERGAQSARVKSSAREAQASRLPHQLRARQRPGRPNGSPASRLH